MQTSFIIIIIMLKVIKGWWPAQHRTFALRSLFECMAWEVMNYLFTVKIWHLRMTTKWHSRSSRRFKCDDGSMEISVQLLCTALCVFVCRSVCEWVRERNIHFNRVCPPRIIICIFLMFLVLVIIFRQDRIIQK
jgi:hypothetical protein